MIDIFWFRRDLRLEDNAGLFHALSAGKSVLPVFIFDTQILSKLPREDARVEFIRETLVKIHNELRAHGSGLKIYHGTPFEVWPRILKDFKVARVYCNEDYEPYAIDRDAKVARLVRAAGAEFHSYKDQVVFSKAEIVKDNGEPYRVYTPYSKKWLATLKPEHLRPLVSNKKLESLAQIRTAEIPTLGELGFKPSSLSIPSPTVKKQIFSDYAKHRDFMGEAATSRLGIHLRFGTISVRKLAALTKPLSEIYLKELIWREFFMHILYHYPHSATASFDPRYDKIKWRNNKEEFQRWCDGETGYPIVDAGMRELNQTGFMHNRARMITASFLSKHLLVDWRWGERYFAEKLLDFDLAANVGNWQWAAGSGCDAAPYFRVFNPYIQAKKFDSEGIYVKKWVPEVGSSQYPAPIVEQEHARRRALIVYKEGLQA